MTKKKCVASLILITSLFLSLFLFNSAPVKAGTQSLTLIKKSGVNIVYINGTIKANNSVTAFNPGEIANITTCDENRPWQWGLFSGYLWGNYTYDGSDTTNNPFYLTMNDNYTVYVYADWNSSVGFGLDESTSGIVDYWFWNNSGSTVALFKRVEKDFRDRFQVAPNSNITGLYTGQDQNNSYGLWLNGGSYTDAWCLTTSTQGLDLYFKTGSGPGGLVVCGEGGAAWESPPGDQPVNINVSITNVGICDDERWIFVEDKYYLFQAAVNAFNGWDVLSHVGIRFTNYANQTTTVYYDFNASQYIQTEGEEYTILDVNKGSYHVDSNNQTVSVIFPIWLSQRTVDSQNIDIYMFSNYTLGGIIPSSWELVETAYFNIYSVGGLKAYESWDNAGLYSYGDVFEMYAIFNKTSSVGGEIHVNQTWRKIQHLQTQFSVHLEKWTGSAWEPEDQLFQTNKTGLDLYEATAHDWDAYCSMWYCDMDRNEWVKGWEVQFYIIEGDMGVTDLWTKWRINWFWRPMGVGPHPTIREQNITLYVEQEPRSMGRIWLDLWYNLENGSRVGGGRVTPYYYGMDGTSMWWWTNWHPMMEENFYSDYFGLLKDFSTALPSTSETISARELDLMKIQFRLKAIQAPDSDTPTYRVSLKEFGRLEPTRTTGEMVGIPTPSTIEPQIPDVGFRGPWSILYNLFSMLIDGIMRAGAVIGDFVWQQLSQYIPWFTDFWEYSYSLINNLWTWFTLIWDYLTVLLSFMYDLVGYLTYPFQIIGLAFGYLTDIWNQTFGTTSNPREVAAIIIIIVFGGVTLDAIAKGDWGYLARLAGTTWRIANTIIQWGFQIMMFFVNLVKLVVNLFRG